MNLHLRLFLFGAALLLPRIAVAGSTFEFVFSTPTVSGPPSSVVSAELVLRETFDGRGAERLDSTNGPGLFSFSVALERGLSTSGVPATIAAATLDAGFSSAVSHVILLGPAGAYTGVELSGAIPPSSFPLVDGPAGTNPLDVPIANITFNTTSVVDLTEFVTAPHPLSSLLQTLDGIGMPIDVSYGRAGHVNTVPESGGPALLGVGFILAFGGRSLLRKVKTLSS